MRDDRIQSGERSGRRLCQRSSRWGRWLPFLFAAAVYAAEPTSPEVASPDGRLRLVFTLTADGAPTYAIFARDEAVVLNSQLGLTTNRVDSSSPDWTGGLKIEAVQRNQADTTWRPVWGERAEIPDRYNAMSVVLRHTAADRGPLRIEVRAYDEGIAFRYAFPEDAKTRVIDLAGEQTEFNVPADSHAYWTPGAQRRYDRLPVRDWKSDGELPVTLELASGHWLSIAEANQTNYARARLHCVGQDRLVTRLFGEVTETSPFATPWRIVLIADEPGRLLEHNYLVQDLNPPNALADTSWIRPGRVMRETTLSTDGAKRLVDFAAEQNIDYIHFDAGWYGDENAVASDATRVSVDPRRNPKGDLDLPEVIRYAKSKGRRVILYVNHRALERQLGEILPLYRSWGVDGIKFGFVQTGSHRWTTWLHDAIKQAAANHLVVDVHDNYRPTGFSRTYPNLLSQEGVLGNEGFPDATHDTILPFTRFLAGAADYTFCFHDKRLMNTKAHQLALPVIYFSPLQFLYWYDRPEDYANRAEIEFWKELPTVWDDTRVIAGRPGESVAVARRHGAEWWLGAITSVNARTMEIPLAFLPPGSSWRAEIYEDAIGKTIVRRTLGVTTTTVLRFDLQPSGGVAARLRAGSK